MKNKIADIKLNHESFISLHAQLHNSLRQLIVSGRWHYGERIPSEPQLAKHLKISRSTVRIALQKAEVEGLIERVAGRGTFVAYENNEQVNSRFVGYVTRSFHSEIHRVLLSSVETELRSAGHNVIFSNAMNNDDEVTVLEDLLKDNVAGLILWANARITPAQRAILEEYQARNIPIVFIDRFVDGITADFVGCDNFGGTHALMQHLIELGHQNIVFLQHNISNLYPIDERYRAFYETMQNHNPTASARWKINSPHHNEFFETDIFQLLEDQDFALSEQIINLFQNATPQPTAIVCANDALAILTIRALRSIGVNIPEDISVVGFDDISLAAYMAVPLTTASQNAHTIGQRAAEILLERLDGNTNPPRHDAIPTRLQIRMSTSTPIVVNQPLSDE